MNHEIAVGSDVVWKRTLYTQGKLPAWIHFTGWASEGFLLITEGAGDYEVLVTTEPPAPDRTYSVGDVDLLAKNYAPLAVTAQIGSGVALVNAIYCATGLETYTELWVWVKTRTPNVSVGVLITRATG